MSDLGMCAYALNNNGKTVLLCRAGTCTLSTLSVRTHLLVVGVDADMHLTGTRCGLSESQRGMRSHCTASNPWAQAKCSFLGLSTFQMEQSSRLEIYEALDVRALSTADVWCCKEDAMEMPVGENSE
jgi:hypothetical protein